MAPEENTAAAEQAEEPTTDSRTASPQADDSTEETDWKALARKWEREAKKNSTAATKASTELERLREANQSAEEKALAAARREGAKAAEAEWKGKWAQERIRGEALRLMNGRVSDPRLAFPHLDLGSDVLADDGSVDATALKSAIDSLLDEYPALALGEAPVHHGDLGPKQNARATHHDDMNALLRATAGVKQ